MTNDGYRIFNAPVPAAQNLLTPALEAVMRVRAERAEQALRDIGECLWTAPDTVLVINLGGHFAVANP